jgi:Co/Zn/Cd efflux system component
MEQLPRDVRRMLHDRYHIEHVTLQVETPETCCEEPHHP